MSLTGTRRFICFPWHFPFHAKTKWNSEHNRIPFDLTRNINLFSHGAMIFAHKEILWLKKTHPKQSLISCKLTPIQRLFHEDSSRSLCNYTFINVSLFEHKNHRYLNELSSVQNLIPRQLNLIPGQRTPLSRVTVTTVIRCHRCQGWQSVLFRLE